ncbi:MAG: hypothetical protein GVY24_00090 [Planctomycetes bacterium]|nr:hypothetical protein [Planctomycetota bacterium]
MVKQDAKQAKAINTLVQKLVSRFKPEEPPATDPIVQLVISFLSWNASTRKAEDAYGKLMSEFVDINELRVSSIDQIVTIIGEDYPEARPRVARMREALHEIFLREHALSTTTLAAKNKKDQRTYLDTLPGMTPYVAAQVMLLSFNGYAMPVDEKLVLLLEREGCVDEGLSPAEVEAALLRQIKAADALKAHLALQAWSDVSRITPPATTGAEATPPPAKAPRSRNTKKKSTRSKKKKIAKKK